MKNIPLPDLYYLENPDLKQLFRIMRISIFLLFFCLFSLMAENSHSQNARVTINRSDAPLESILNEIESQTDYLFIYKEDVNVKMRKTIQVNGKPVSEVLPILLTGSSIGYKMEGNHIILTRDVALAAQQQGVTGVVTDVLGEPLIGVTVMLKGDMQGTVTDINGRFSLSAEQGDVIVVSYLGYASQEIRLKDTKLLRIMMKEDVELLDEVVVIGYGSISKKELTSAVSHISGKDMLQIGSGNPAMQIQGKVSGLAVENSTPSDPNSSPSIQVRGVSSRSAGLGPLIVIDGIPGGSLDNLNENDIGSIDVLKDGAASAIYGTRGSNGVIVVTTKKGTMDGKIHTSYSGFVNITTPVRELNVLSATDFREQKRGDDYGADTDWFDELTKVAVSHSHTLQVMGGVRLSFWEEHLIPVKTEEFFRMGAVKAVTQYGLRRIVVLLMVQTVHTSKVWNPTFGRDTGTAKKYNVIVSINDFLQFLNLFLQIFHKLFLLFLMRITKIMKILFQYRLQTGVSRTDRQIFKQL